jgi:outer membrane immunogenic protein
MKIPILLLVAVTAASPAAAQDSFTGPFAGIQGGWERHKVDTVSTDIGVLDPRKDSDSFTGGVFVGYDLQVAPWLVTGVELGASLIEGGEVRRSARGQTFEIDAKRSFDATVRAGVPITRRTLAYARGGYANMRVNARLRGPDATRRDSVDLDGWQAGGGLEQRLLANVSTRLEYRYASFGGDNDYDRHDVLLGATFRF